MTELEKQSVTIKHGGARPGAGRPAGVANKATAEVREIARQWGPSAIEEAAKLAGLVKDDAGNPVGRADNDRARIAALNIVLERAYGRPPLAIGGDDDSPPIEVRHSVGDRTSFSDFLAEALAETAHAHDSSDHENSRAE